RGTSRGRHLRAHRKLSLSSRSMLQTASNRYKRNQHTGTSDIIFYSQARVNPTNDTAQHSGGPKANATPLLLNIFSRLYDHLCAKRVGRWPVAPAPALRADNPVVRSPAAVIRPCLPGAPTHSRQENPLAQRS